MKLTQDEIESAYFDGVQPNFTGCKFIAAHGYMGDYEEDFTCYFEKDGEVYEASSSHCSCNGFDWEPAKVSREYLRSIAENKSSEVAEEIKSYLHETGN